MTERAPAKIIEFKVPKEGRLIPEDVIGHIAVGTLEDDTPGTLVFAGIGQNEKTAHRITRLVEGVDVAAAPHYWEVPPTFASLEALSIGWSIAAAEAWQEAHGSTELIPNVIAESQQSVTAAWGERERPELFGHMSYHHPMAFNAEFLGDTPGKRAATMGRRALVSALQWDQNPLNDPWNVVNGGRILRRMSLLTIRQVGIGLGVDITELVAERANARAVNGKRTIVEAAERDKLAKVIEFKRSRERMGNTAVEMYFSKGSHRSMGTRSGAADLRQTNARLLEAA